MDHLIDTHIHLDAPELEGSAEKLLEKARSQGIDGLVIPGVRVDAWQGLVALASRSEGVFAAPGLHPAYAQQWNGGAAAELRELAAQPSVVAIGEIGLDGSKGPDEKTQRQALEAQLEIAMTAGLPVLLHGRQATGKLLEVLRETGVGAAVGGIWHGYSGSVEVAEELIELGFAIGVGPILLRANARKLPMAVQQLPASALVLETDLPDMAEQPDALRAVAARLGELRGWSLAETIRITSGNALRILEKMAAAAGPHTPAE